MRRLAALLALALLLVLPFRASAQPAESPDPANARWMVDLARGMGLSRAGKQTAADVLQIQTLLRGAVRLDPQSTDALLLLYEIACLAGDEARADELLDTLLQRQPHNENIFARCIEQRLEAAQSIEQQRRWLESSLGPPRSANQIAMAQAYLGLLAARGLDPAEARRRLETARSACPECPEVVTLESVLATSDAPLGEQARARLRAVQMNPLNPHLAWSAAEFLTENGFPQQAGVLFDHAVRLFEQAKATDELTARMHMQLSESYLLREKGNALYHAQQAVLKRGASFEPAFYSLWFATLFLGESVAGSINQSISSNFNAISDPDRTSVDTAIYAGWYYTMFQRRPERGLRFATSALRRAPDSIVARRVYGWALAAVGRTDEAIEALEDIAAKDPYAAFRLAKIYKDAGDEDAAVRVVLSVRNVPATGFIRSLLNGLNLPLPASASQPASERFPEVMAAFAEFNQDVLSYDLAPGEALQVEIVPLKTDFQIAEPWEVDFILTNRASYTITLGPEGMTNPVLLLSFVMDGASRREFPNLMSVFIDDVRWLKPGQSCRVRRTLDIGPLRGVSRATPQQLQTVTFSAILDPLPVGGGRWGPALGGQTIPKIKFNRIPASGGSAAIQAHLAGVNDFDRTIRLRSIDALTQFLGETQRQQAGKATYRLIPTPAESVIPTLVAALTGEDWELRAHTLNAIQIAGLDARLVDAAKTCLRHPHWLVRLMAVRLFERQIELVRGELEQMSQSDADRGVQDYCRATLDRHIARMARTENEPSVSE